LLVVVCLAIAYAAGRFGGSDAVAKNNFTKDVWMNSGTDAATWSRTLTLCMYAFWGFEQPFYVLAEAKSPRKYFPKYTVFSLGTLIVLYMLVNISYLLVVDKRQVIKHTPEEIGDVSDMASLFFSKLFNGDDEKGARAMSAIVATSIFGNLWVMTFTAARVKQEIAKEGILPWSLYIATSYKTPYGLWKKWRSSGSVSEEEVEKAPTAAFALHWFTSVLLVVLVSPIQKPTLAYGALVQLYSYTIISLFGCWVSIGLLRVKLRKSRWHWQERRRYRPWLSPLHAIIFGLATAFMLVAAFVPPQYGSPFHQSVTGMAWFIVPIVGITAPLWGMIWYGGLLAYEWKIGRHLVVSREAYWSPDPDCPGEFIQQAEIIDHTWQITLRKEMADDFEVPYGVTEELKSPYVGQQERDLDGDSPRLESQPRAHRTEAMGRRAPMASERRLSDSFD
jgi:amino acid transporter